jgi:hypothetical protein
MIAPGCAPDLGTDRGVRRAVRRAEALRADAVGNLMVQLRAREFGQLRVRHRVIPDGVARGTDLVDQVGVLVSVFGEHEEGAARVVRLQYGEHLGRQGISRTPYALLLSDGRE